MTIKTKLKLQRKLINKHIKDENDCWIYQGCTQEGYCPIHFEGRSMYAHRAAMIVFRNRPDLVHNKNLFVCHKCDNKRCVNPEHLYVGTWIENNMDTALRDPSVTKEFMEASAKLFAQKYKVRCWRKIKSIDKYCK